MKRLLYKVFFIGLGVLIVISILTRSNDPCRKYVASHPYPIDSQMISAIAIVNSQNFKETELKSLFLKIEKDFPVIILTTLPLKNANSAFDLSNIIDESLVVCDNNAFGFYPNRFSSWLKLIDADTTDLPEYSYLNYIDISGELFVVDKSNFADVNFYQRIVIVGDVGGGVLGKDFYTVNGNTKIKLYKPHILASMIYTLVKKEFFTFPPGWIVFIYTILLSLVLSICSIFLMRINKLVRYMIYKLIQGVLLYSVYLIVISMLSNESNYVVNFGHLFILIMIGGEIIFWITFQLNKKYQIVYG